MSVTPLRWRLTHIKDISNPLQYLLWLSDLIIETAFLVALTIILDVNENQSKKLFTRSKGLEQNEAPKDYLQFTISSHMWYDSAMMSLHTVINFSIDFP